MESVQFSDGGTQVGTLFSSLGHFMGRRIQSTFEVTKFESNKNYDFKTISGPVQLQTSYKFESVNRGTNVIISTLVNPGGILQTGGSHRDKSGQKRFKENLAKLKEILESKETNRKR